MNPIEFQESPIQNEAKNYAEMSQAIRLAVDSGQSLSEEHKSFLVKLVKSYLGQNVRVGVPIDDSVLQEVTKLVPDIAKQIQSGEGDLVELAKKIDMDGQALEATRVERMPNSSDFELVSPRDQRRIISWGIKDMEKFRKEFRGDFASEAEYQAYLEEIRNTLAELQPNKVPDWFLPGTKEHEERKKYLLLEPTERIIDTVGATRDGLSAGIILLRDKLQKIFDSLVKNQGEVQNQVGETVSAEK